MGRTFDEVHQSGFNPETRAADQDRDGVAGEIIYPTVGMMLCNHKDGDFKQACFEAYNRWISRVLLPRPGTAVRARPDGRPHRRRRDPAT